MCFSWAGGDAALASNAGTRAPKGGADIPKGLVVATIYSFMDPIGSEFIDFFARVMRPELQLAGVTVRATYVTEASPNNLPRLPVREGERVFVCFTSFDEELDYERSRSRLAKSAAWQTVVTTLQHKLKGQPEVLRLQRTPRSPLPFVLASAHDFDFLIGDWTVHHRRLKRRLEGNTEWIEFESPAAVRKILDGFANMDEISINLPDGAYTGGTLRLFNPNTQSWSIHWMDSRHPGLLDAPMVGRFENGRSVFFGNDTFDGQSIRVRSSGRPSGARPEHWEQAFSADDEITWKTNWTMSFQKA